MSEDEPECTDHATFAMEIQDAVAKSVASTAGRQRVVIVEGHQLLHSPEARSKLTGPLYLLELDREECIHRAYPILCRPSGHSIFSSSSSSSSSSAQG